MYSWVQLHFPKRAGAPAYRALCEGWGCFTMLVSRPTTSGCLLQRANILDHRLGPAVDVRPLAVADAVLVAGDVHQVVALAEGVRLGRIELQVAILLVGEHDHAICGVLMLHGVI